MADMTRHELTKAVAAQAAVTMIVADKVIRALAEVAVDEVAAGRNIRLFGIGKLTISERQARPARVLRGPNAGATVMVPARKALRFVPQGPLIEALSTLAQAAK